ncbi:MAG TPA: hypothetical protein VF495_13240 [Phenylobacterium sp.]
MIARRRTAFLKMVRLLRAAEADPTDIAAVRALNLGLLKEILRDEGHVHRLRGEIKTVGRRLRVERLDKASAALLRRSIKRQERALDRYLDQIFIWKCLGDGLAHAYIDTFNLKHAYFDTQSTDRRPDAGFMSGKSGLALEVDVLKGVLRAGVPAVLCDLTHVLRHGDVCILAGEDPSFIEVKSGATLNQRGQRQLERLNQLSRFLTNDGEPGFRGLPDVRRETMHSRPRDCIEDLNRCVEGAWRDGYNAVSPERGLVYLACYGEDPPIDDLLPHLGMGALLAFFPNGDKIDRTWAPYRPFVNSLRDVDRLYDFVVGALKIFVFVDAAHLCEGLAMPGFRASLVEDRALAIVAENRTLGGHVAVSQQFVGRMGYEFLSPAWFIEEHRAVITALYEGAQLAAPAGLPAPDLDPLDAAASEATAATVAAMPRRYTAEGPTA